MIYLQAIACKLVDQTTSSKIWFAAAAIISSLGSGGQNLGHILFCRPTVTGFTVSLFTV